MLPTGDNEPKGALTSQNIASAIAIYKQVLGPAAGALSLSSDSGVKGQLMKEIEHKLKQLEDSVKTQESLPKNERRYQYLDDKALYQE